MKNLFYLLCIAAMLTSCATTYIQSKDDLIKSKVTLKDTKFNNLGMFCGSASEKRVKAGIKNKEGLIAQARMELLANARKAGVSMSGSRTLNNISVDIIKNAKRFTVTVCADVIEFTD